MGFRFALVDLESALPNITSYLAMPRHGVLPVGTAAKAAGHDVEVYVEILNGIPLARLAEMDVVGAAVTAPNLSRVRSLFNTLKQHNPDIVLIAGGPHSTVSPTEVLRFADIVVRDEAEVTIVELLNAVDDCRSLSDVAGISFVNGGRVCHTSRRPYLSRYDRMDDLSLLTGYQRRSMAEQLSSGHLAYGLTVTSRGCPFPCSFCYENMIGGTGFRQRAEPAIVEDVRRKRDFFGTSNFWLADSNFGTNPAHASGVLDALIKADLGCQFTVLCRVEIGRRPDLLSQMQRAGVKTISIGMEALEDRTLKSIDKRQTLDDIRRAIDAIHNAGISVFGLFMVGFDNDTDTTPWNIVDFCRRENIGGLSIYCMTEVPDLPGRSLPRHRICETDLDYYNGHFVTTFPRSTRPSTLEHNVFEALCSFYDASGINPRAVRSVDGVPQVARAISVQMRRMARISRRHQEVLRKAEEGYYSPDGRLNIDRLTQHPWLTTQVPPDTLADWTDAREASEHSENTEPAPKGPRSLNVL